MKFAKHLSGLVILLSVSASLWAQPAYRLSKGIPVTSATNDPIDNFWSGGMSAPQFSSVDVDQDGLRDMVVFDREDNVFVAFRNTGVVGKFDYMPSWTSVFDSCECYGWALLRDYNCDGREDLFCGTETSNLVVYDNLEDNGMVRFERSYTNVISNPPNWPFAPLWLYTSKIDLPAIVDVDGDNDLDLLTFSLLSNYVSWNRNYAQERYNRCDTLAFETGSSCFGHFFESSSNNNIILHDTVFCELDGFSPELLIRNPEAAPTRHAGSSILALDMNGDSLMEVLIGDISYNAAIAVYNNGRKDYAYMDSIDLNFPSTDVPIDIAVFPAFYYEDVNGDGKRDLLVAPNLSNSLSENVDGLLWYRNIGRDDSAVFTYEGRDFMISENHDAGSNSSVTFFDENGDGKKDLLIGNRFAFYRSGGTDVYRDELHLLRNTGTVSAPSYQLVTRNFLNVQAGSLSRFTGLSPASGDVDGDGDEDLLFGNSFGEIFFFRNDAGPNQPANYVLGNAKLGNIDVGNFSSPALFDFDNDGDLDLFVGNEGGTIAYYRNEGNLTFSLAAQRFGKIKISNSFGQPNTGCASPTFADWNGDGLTDLILGGEEGYIDVFTQIQTGLTDSLIASERVLNRRLGAYVKPTAAILGTSGKPTLVLGEAKGGLFLVTPTLDGNVSIGPEKIALPLKAYPNPVSDALTVEWEANGQETELTLVSLLGEVLFSQTTREARALIPFEQLPSGVYLLRVRSGALTATQKIVRP